MQENHIENTLQNNESLKEKYKNLTDKEGYIGLSQAREEFAGRQIKNIASLLDGDEGTSPEYNLGEGLDFKGKSGNYSDMKIHVDSLNEFVRRINNHYK